MSVQTIQRASGGYDGNGSVSLAGSVTEDGSPGSGVTTAGNRLIISVSSTAPLATPSGFTRDSSATNASNYFFSKPTVDGESSWTLNNQTGSASLEYDVFEMSGIDPDAPVDVATGATGTGGSTGTSPPSTTYDGVILGQHRAIGTAGGSTVPTFEAHTNNEELSDHGHASGVGFTPIGISTCRRFVQSLGTWECDCDATPGTFTGQAGTLVVYSAEGAKREPTVSHFWSFPAELAGLTGLEINVGVAGYFASVTGSPVILAGGGLQLTGSNSIENVNAPPQTVPTNGKGHVANLKFRLNSLPGDLRLATLNDAGGGPITIWYRAASQKIGVVVGNGTEVLSDATVTTGQDYSLDIRNRQTGTIGRIVDWKLDYGSGPVVQTQATGNGTSGLGTMTPGLGWGTASTGQVTFWHAIYSTVSGHYPLTAHWVFPFLKPDTAGTITARTGTTADLRRFTANGGTIAGSFNSADIIAALRDWPPVFGASADGAAIINASTGTYSIPMETYDAAANGGSVRTVALLTAFWAASTTTATIRINGHDGSLAVTLLGELDVNADNSSTPPWYYTLWRPVGGWTQAKLDAAAIDLSSADATPDIGPHAMALIAAVRLAETVPVFGGTSELRVEEMGDPDTGGIVSLHTYTPSGQSATLTYEVNGVPVVANGGNPIPGGSNPHIELIAAPDLPTVNRIELKPG